MRFWPRHPPARPYNVGSGSTLGRRAEKPGTAFPLMAVARPRYRCWPTAAWKQPHPPWWDTRPQKPWNIIEPTIVPLSRNLLTLLGPKSPLGSAIAIDVYLRWAAAATAVPACALASSAARYAAESDDCRLSLQWK
jgi:hypothetical protein